MPLDIQQAHGQAVELGFADVLDLGAAAKQIARRQVVGQALTHAAVEIQHIGFGEGVAEAEHRHLVAHFGKAGTRRTTNPLSRRIDGNQVRMCRFQGL